MFFMIEALHKQPWWLRKKSNFYVALHPSSLQRTARTPHSSGFARLEFGAFYFAFEFRLFTRLSTLEYYNWGLFDNPLFNFSRIYIGRRSRVQGSILVPELHLWCVFTRKASVSSGQILNLKLNWQLLGKMNICNEDFGSLLPSLSLTLNVEPWTRERLPILYVLCTI